MSFCDHHFCFTVVSLTRVPSRKRPAMIWPHFRISEVVAYQSFDCTEKNMSDKKWLQEFPLMHGYMYLSLTPTIANSRKFWPNNKLQVSIYGQSSGTYNDLSKNLFFMPGRGQDNLWIQKSEIKSSWIKISIALRWFYRIYLPTYLTWEFWHGTLH